MRRERLLPKGFAAALAALCLATLPSLWSSQSAAAAAPAPWPVGRVEMYVHPPGSGGRSLVLDLYPLRGIAVVSTIEGEPLDLDPYLRDSYAIAIPKAPFDGQIDLHFPKLGRIVGSVGPEGIARSFTTAACDKVPARVGKFGGKIPFRGAPPGVSATTKVTTVVSPECGKDPSGRVGPDELFGALAEEGGVILPGPSGFRFLAHRRAPGRAIEFFAFGNHPTRFFGAFAAIDREWLPGEIATQRVVTQTTRGSAAALALGPGGDRPDRITFKPPAPFFGQATYRRGTGKLRGSLGVHFSGLTLHLARRPLAGILEDEDSR